MCTCSNGTDTCATVGYCQFRPQPGSPFYDPYTYDSLPPEFCRSSWIEGGFAGISRMSTMQVAADAFNKSLAALPPQQTSIGTIANFAISTIREWYQPFRVIEGRVLTEQLAASTASAYSVGPFGWLTDNSSSYAGRGTSQSLPSYIRSWFASMDNYYNQYGSSMPIHSGLEPPENLSYGQLSIAIPLGGTILYLSGRVVGTLPVNASIGLLVFDGTLAAPQYPTGRPVCVLSGDKQSQYVYGFIRSKPVDGSSNVETTLHLRSDPVMGYPVLDYWMRPRFYRPPLPKAYPGPQSIPPLNFSGLIQANFYYLDGNGKLLSD